MTDEHTEITPEVTTKSVVEDRAYLVTVGPLSVHPKRQIYALIVVLATLSVIHLGGPLDAAAVGYVSAIIAAPMFALMMAHAYSEAASIQITCGRPLTWPERWHLLRDNFEFIWFGITFSLLLWPMVALRLDVDQAVDVLLLIGLCGLFGWGYTVGKRTGISLGRRFVMAMNYALLGLVVVVVEILAHHLA